MTIKYFLHKTYRKSIFKLDKIFGITYDFIQNKDFHTMVLDTRYKASKIHEVKFLFKTINSDQRTFLDIGSGKGLILNIAKKFPFKKIYGVEICKELVEISINNTKESPDNRLSILNSNIFLMPKSIFDTIDYIYIFNALPRDATLSLVTFIEASYLRNNRDIDIIFTGYDKSIDFSDHATLRFEKEIYNFFVSNSPAAHYKLHRKNNDIHFQ